MGGGGRRIASLRPAETTSGVLAQPDLHDESLSPKPTELRAQRRKKIKQCWVGQRDGAASEERKSHLPMILHGWHLPLFSTLDQLGPRVAGPSILRASGYPDRPQAPQPCLCLAVPIRGETHPESSLLWPLLSAHLLTVRAIVCLHVRASVTLRTIKRFSSAFPAGTQDVHRCHRCQLGSRGT